MVRLSIAFMLLVLVAGCASGPTDSKFSLESKTDTARTGIVFGKICEGNGLWFREVASSKEILHIGGSIEFALRLPPGKYVLAEMGSPSGRTFTSPTPFAFEVHANEVVYVGTLMPSWVNVAPRFPGQCDKEERAIVGKKMYGQSSPTWEVLLADDKNEAIKAVKVRYPNADLSGAVTRLMQ